MKRPLLVWLVFALCALTGLAVLGWFTIERMRLDRDAAHAREIAAREERVRLALWRLDSAVSAIHGTEAARPVSDYTPFHTPSLAFGSNLAPIRTDSLLLPSPLLSAPPQFVRMHLQVSASGTVTSPQAPEPSAREAAVRAGLPAPLLEDTARLLTGEPLRTLAGKISLQPELAKAPALQRFAAADSARQMPEEELAEAASPSVRQSRDEMRKSSVELQQRVELADANYLARNRSESVAPSTAREPAVPRAERGFEAAAEAAKEMAPAQAAGSAMLAVSAPPAAHARASSLLDPDSSSIQPIAGPLIAQWIDGELFLVREVRGAEDIRAQAVWMDWHGLQAWLLGRVRDLLPAAGLEPVLAEPAPGTQLRDLAILPVRLDPGPLPYLDSTVGDAAPSLLLAWLLALVGVGALALLLAGTLRLSERRAAFVSAVTHELRTPLTTFRMYSEMLAGGMVADPGKRQSYLETLQKEAGRLSHLVENVLSYARLERGSARSRVEDTTPGDLMDRIAERLGERAGQAGMEFSIRHESASQDLALRTDATGFEQVVFNLVDNAAKYARVAGRTGRIEVELRAAAKGRLQVRVIDNGPGLTPVARRRLFQPFSKSATDAAHSQPGVGLGLSLSRRIARTELKGDLRLERTGPDGTCFLLEVGAPRR